MNECDLSDTVAGALYRN